MLKKIQVVALILMLMSALILSGCGSERSAERAAADRPEEREITLHLMAHLISQQKAAMTSANAANSQGETPVFFAAELGLDGQYHDPGAAVMARLMDQYPDIRKFSQIVIENRECFQDSASKKCGAIVAVGLYEWAGLDEVKVTGIIHPGEKAGQNGCTYRYVRTAGKWAIKEFSSCFGK